jgi:hypothetical protein
MDNPEFKKVKVISYKSSGAILSNLVNKEVIFVAKYGNYRNPVTNKNSERFIVLQNRENLKTRNDVYLELINGNYMIVYGDDLDLESSSDYKPKIKLKKKREEVLDEYGQSMVVKLKEDEKTIYLSTSLRTTLDIKDGDNIGFGFNDSNGTILLYKEIEPNQGWPIENGQIVSSADWRELYQIFESTTLYYNLNSGVVLDLDYPDYEFYLLSTHDNSQKKSKNTTVKVNTKTEFKQPQYWIPNDLSSNISEYLKKQLETVTTVSGGTGVTVGMNDLTTVAVKDIDDISTVEKDFSTDIKRRSQNYIARQDWPYSFEKLKDAADSIIESNEKEDKKLEF